MKGRRRTTITMGILIAAVFLTAGGSMLYAHLGPQWGPGCWNPEERAAWITDRLTKRLDLNDTQRQELEAIVTELGEKRKELHELHSKTRDELLGILRGKTIDQARVSQMVEEHKQRIGDLITSAGDRLTDFAAKLAPEQRARLADAIEEHTAFFHGHMH